MDWQNDLPEPDPEAIARHLHLPNLNGLKFHVFRALGRVAVVAAHPGKLAIALQNARSASRNSGWDVDPMSDEDFEHRTTWFRQAVVNLDGVDERLADRLVTEGYLLFADLAVIDPIGLREYGHLSDEVVERIIRQAEINAVEMHRR